jgi:hypothetical protein
MFKNRLDSNQFNFPNESQTSAANDDEWAANPNETDDSHVEEEAKTEGAEDEKKP